MRRKRQNKSKKYRYRKGGFGSARQAFTRRFVQGATQTGKQIISEVGKDIAGRVTKSTLQDENEGTVSERADRIVKRAFNVPRDKPTTPKLTTPKLTTMKQSTLKTPLVVPFQPIAKDFGKIRAMR